MKKINLKTIFPRAKNFLISSDISLKKQVFKSTFWVFFGKLINIFLIFIRTIILARFLSPDDFGLFGVASLILGALEAFSQTGVQQALINKNKNSDKYLDAAWTLQLFRSFLIGLILVFISPLAAKFFNEPRATSIIQVFALIEIIKGMNNIGIVYFEKKLKFHKQFIFQILGAFTDLTIAFVLAIILKSVWALIFALLGKTIIQLLLSYSLQNYRPKLDFNFKKIKNLTNYGKWVLGVGILVFIGGQGDDLFVGKAIGVEALGLYQMAYSFSQLPSFQLTYVINNVAFPVYSKIQNDKKRLRNAYFKIAGISTFFSIPFAAFIALFAKEFTTIFLGEQWISIIKTIQILAAASLVKSIISTSSPLFYGLGKPNYEFQMQLIRAIFIIFLIYPLTNRWGIEGAALTVLLSALSMFVVYLIKTTSLLNLKTKELFQFLNLPIFATILTYTSTLIIKSKLNIITPESHLIEIILFICLVIFSVLFYLFSLFFLEKYFLKTKRTIYLINLFFNKILRINKQL